MRSSPLIRLIVLLALVVSIGGHGCGDDSGKRSPSAREKSPAAGPSASGGTGAIRGTVSLRGEPPVMREIPNQPCHAGAAPMQDESIVSDDRGRLANVVVFLREAPAATGLARPPAVLDQVDCRYVPHVMALRAGQVLRVKTSDPAVHNVHAASSANPPRNFGMQPGAGPVELTFAKPEAFTIKCDVHPWMNAHVHVFDHDQFAVTVEDGTFELNAVPAGEYTLVFRHELFGDIEENIELADGQTLTKEATYEKPG